jgi:predicted metal-dependent hydrolase
MPRSDTQLTLPFLRPQKKKGGLEIEQYRELVDRLRADAARVAERFRLPPYELDADRPDAHERYGVCFDDGRIRVRLTHARTGRPLRYSALIDTVVHELAHLRHMNHGPRWKALYEKMLAWCRREGIYAPSLRRESAAPAIFTPQQRLCFSIGAVRPDRLE